MKKSVKTESVVKVYNLIKDARYSKMSDGDKIAVWKIFKAIKPIASSFIEDVNDARQKLVPSESFQQDLQRAREYEIARSKKEVCAVMSESEYKEFVMQFTHYNKLVEQAIREYTEAEIEIEFAPLSQDAFEKLSLSNDWTFAQSDAVESFVCQ